MTNVDIRKLRHAVVLAKEGSFVRASEKLNLSQSALTRSIQSLEDQLEVKIFERLAGGVAPTALGHAVIERAHLILLQINGFIHGIELLRNGEVGKAVFGVSTMVTTGLGNFLSAASQRSPKLNLRVEIKSPDQLMEALLAEKIEFFVSELGTLCAIDGIEIRPLATIPLELFVRRGHPLSIRAQVHSSDITEFPLAMTCFSSESLIFPNSIAAFVKKTQKGYISCEDLFTLKTVALQTDAVLLASRWVLEPEFSTGELRKVNLIDADLSIMYNLGIVHLSGRMLSPAAQSLINDAFARVSSLTVASAEPAPSVNNMLLESTLSINLDEFP